jgi:predicted GNAT superfamily acetyltransferase
MIRNATAGDFDSVLALNEESVRFLSPLTPERLRHLDKNAACHKVVESESRVVAFLIAFREGADYDSPNYAWFSERYTKFLYIDRVVVQPSQRGRGLGAVLYDDIIEFAKRTQVALLTCEFDLDPPNPVSSAFHKRYGFSEVGTQWLNGGKKQVSLQAKTIGP